MKNITQKYLYSIILYIDISYDFNKMFTKSFLKKWKEKAENSTYVKSKSKNKNKKVNLLQYRYNCQKTYERYKYNNIMTKDWKSGGGGFYPTSIKKFMINPSKNKFGN